jgi:hypothetical protein
MSDVEAAEFRVRLRAARLRQELDQRRELPSPDWVAAVVAEGEARERESESSGS